MNDQRDPAVKHAANGGNIRLIAGWHQLPFGH